MEEMLVTTILFLNQVEVSGKKNLTHLLAAIRNLEELKSALKNQREKEENHENQ